ncbi:MAG: HTH-type transcriptional regulator DegA [Lentisphaerae bacterium ADurb.Bin242]|nr:MAG: HTH-type transcriptional regulator DegA [Lentisphaerae bacterium ADurb.Bin242]
MTVRLKDIAEKLGMNPGSVSRILRGGAQAERFSSATREKVFTLSRKLGYQRDELAASIITGKTNTIGLFQSFQSGDYNYRLLNSLICEAGKYNYFIKTLNWDGWMSAEEIAKICVSQRLTALVAYGVAPLYPKLKRLLEKHGIMLILAGECLIRGMKQEPIAVVSMDGYEGGRLAFDHLYGLGHRRFAMMGFLDGAYGWFQKSKIAEEVDKYMMEWQLKRRKGFRDAAHEAGIPDKDVIDVVIEYSLTMDYDETMLKKYFKGRNRISAIFVYPGDILAVNIISRLHRAGIRVPEDVSVMTYGGTRFAAMVYPTLSLVEDPLEEIGCRCIRIIMENRTSKTPDISNFSETVPGKLIVRNSTAEYKME